MDLRMLLAALFLYSILVTAQSISINYVVYSTPKPSARTYPILSQTICPTKGRGMKSGICKNTCMRQFMTPVVLKPVTWYNNGVITSATVNWTHPHWGDSKAKHIPLALQAELVAKTAHVPDPQYSAWVSDFLSKQADTKSHKKGPPPITSKPTLKVKPSDCVPDETRHTPVPYGIPEVGLHVRTQTPSNPECDLYDPNGFDEAERLWLFQNKKQRYRGKSESITHLECWDYESCYDHCDRIKKKDAKLRRILMAVVGAVGGVGILGVIVKHLLEKRKNKKKDKNAAAQAKEKWGNETQPAAASGQHVDGAVDGTADGTAEAAAAADEESARRAAAMFRSVFNRAVVDRRDAVASGSETTPEENGAVTRRAS